MKFTLKSRHQEAKDTYTYIFAGDHNFTYLPGQYIYLTLPKLNYSDSRGATRHFTLSSSPTEKYIYSITTRIRKESGYKQTLFSLDNGAVLEAEGPNGDFVLDAQRKSNQVFLAGGIGITPFRSIIKYQIDNRFYTPIHLIYSNSTAEEITFKDELLSWAKYDNFKLDLTVSHADSRSNKWNGLTGRIDGAMIKHLVADNLISKSTYWLCGPPPFVRAMEEILRKLPVKSSQIISEKFTGY